MPHLQLSGKTAQAAGDWVTADEASSLSEVNKNLLVK